METRRLNFWIRIKRIAEQLLNKEAASIIYELEYNNDTNSGMLRKEKVYCRNLQEDIHKKTESLTAIGLRSAEKLEAIPDDQLTDFS